MARVIVDTGPLYAMLDRGDKFFDWSTSQLKNIRPPLMTCDAVLTETFFLAAKDARACQALGVFLKKDIIISRFDSMANCGRVLELMATYRGTPMSFADACLVCMVENNPGSVIFTLDRDFTVYRQHRRRTIPLIAPF